MAMFQGNWTCSKCGGGIKELPFEPRSNSGLTCRDCYFNSKQGDAQGASSDANAAILDVDTGAAGEMDDRDIPDFDPGDMAVASEPQEDDGLDQAGASTSSAKPMFEGDWKCSECGAAITSLPFKPFNTENLKCLDCFKRSKE